MAAHIENNVEGKRRVLNAAQLQRTTGVIAGAFVLSGLLGVVRGAVIGARFGAGSDLDAFYAAYRIPELLFNLVAGGALGSAFIPVFGRFLGKDDPDGAWRLASAVMTLVALLATILAVVAGFLADLIVARLLIPEAPAAQQALTASLMRIMLCTVVIFSLSGLIMGILNTHQYFLTPALAPSMNNLGLIVGALAFAPRFGIYGLAGGAVLGALLHIGIQLPELRRVKARLYPLADTRVSGVREVLWLMGPRVLGAAVVQINFVVNAALSSGMAAGSYTALTMAFGLMFTILGILGQSVGTAVFPSLVALGTQGDMDGYRRTLSGATRGVLFLSLPATVGLIVLGMPLVATIYQHGRWSAADTLATTWALQFFALGLSAFALQEIFARAFYALHDTKTPVAIAVSGMILNVILSLLLIHLVQGQRIPFGPSAGPFKSLALWTESAGQGPFGGLALANALATIIESLFLWLFLRRRAGDQNGLDDRRILGMAVRALIASLVMGIVLAFGIRFVSLSPLITLIVGTVVGLLVFEGTALALGLPEARSVPDTILRKFRR